MSKQTHWSGKFLGGIPNLLLYDMNGRVCLVPQRSPLGWAWQENRRMDPRFSRRPSPTLDSWQEALVLYNKRHTLHKVKFLQHKEEMT